MFHIEEWLILITKDTGGVLMVVSGVKLFEAIITTKESYSALKDLAYIIKIVWIILILFMLRIDSGSVVIKFIKYRY